MNKGSGKSTSPILHSHINIPNVINAIETHLQSNANESKCVDISSKDQVQGIKQAKTSIAQEVNGKDNGKATMTQNPINQSTLPQPNTYPKVSNNFGKFVPNNQKQKQNANQNNTKDLPSQNNPNAPISNTKKDQAPAPYTVVQTLAARLRVNQAKAETPINLANPKITTKQGMPAVIFKKDDFMVKLAARCKYTLVGKFSNTMPKVEMIRRNFILQTQLSGGVKIAHFNARHVYIDLDNELDYITVWTKQRMTIEGQLMRIQTWTPTFRPDEETPIVPIWISLPELPCHCYNKEFVTALLSPIGKVMYLDAASIQKTRGSLAKVRVQMDLTKTRPPHVWMGFDEEDITVGRWKAINMIMCWITACTANIKVI